MKIFKKMGILIAVIMATLCVSLTACGSNSAVYSNEYDDADEYLEAELPVHTINGKQAFAMMGIESVTIKVTFKDGTYTLESIDKGNQDKSNSKYFLREWKWTGDYTEANGVYTLAEAKTGTVVVDYGSEFAAYEVYFGKTGTFDDKADMFKGCTATVKDGKITYTVAK